MAFGIGFGSFSKGSFYTSGSLYRRHGGYQFATAKFSTSFSSTIRRADRASLSAQLTSVAPAVFAQTASASEQKSVLAVQQLQARIAEVVQAARASRTSAVKSGQALNLRV